MQYTTMDVIDIASAAFRAGVIFGSDAMDKPINRGDLTSARMACIESLMREGMIENVIKGDKQCQTS